MKKRKVAFILCLAFLVFGCPGDSGGDGPGFHKKTKLTPAAILKGPAGQGVKHRGKKRYPGLTVVSLPKAEYKGMPLEEAIRKRRSIRSYSGKPMEVAELSNLMFAAQGITGRLFGKKFRAAPSAGALYPMELYVVVHNVSGLAPGLYHYDPSAHSLTELKRGDMRDAICNAGLGQKALREANLVIVFTAVPARTTQKYGDRGFRYIYMEAGHIAENILLEAVSLKLGAVPMGAFFDDGLDGLLGIDGKTEMSLYLVAVGKI